MERIFNDAKDKNVSATVIHGKGSDGKAYIDAGGTVQFTTSELKEAFLKRAVIMIGTDCYIPVIFSVASGIGTVKYAKPNTSTATSADLGSLVSVKDPVEK